MDPFVAEIRIFPFNFAPKGWAFCDGQILPLSQNTALFSLLGTTYGGNGKSNFALPNLQGCAPMHPGQGPGLSLHDLGESGGADTVALLDSELPAHTHPMSACTQSADSRDPAGRLLAKADSEIYRTPGGFTAAQPSSNQPHNNMQPYLTLSFCIALQGVYPPRT
jgi:microcystin-dependent protein